MTDSTRIDCLVFLRERRAVMRGTVAQRDELRRTVLVYSDVRRLQGYRDLAELDALFEAIIDAAEAVLKSDPQGEGGQAAMNTCPMCSEQEGATAERDELRERVARLEAERDEADDTCNRRLHDLTRLRTALERYGQHDEGCEWHDHRWHGQRGPCTCALAEALTLPEVDEG